MATTSTTDSTGQRPIAGRTTAPTIESHADGISLGAIERSTQDRPQPDTRAVAEPSRLARDTVRIAFQDSKKRLFLQHHEIAIGETEENVMAAILGLWKTATDANAVGHRFRLALFSLDIEIGDLIGVRNLIALASVRTSG